MPAQYEYKFVRVEVGGGAWSAFDTDYQDSIKQHALLGWRFVQAYAPNSMGIVRSAVCCDLIFERKKEE